MLCVFADTLEECLNVDHENASDLDQHHLRLCFPDDRSWTEIIVAGHSKLDFPYTQDLVKDIR